MKLTKGLIYIAATSIFIVAFTVILETLMSIGRSQLNGLLLSLELILFTSVISIAFSHQHLRDLLRSSGKVKISIPKIIVAVLAIVALHIDFIYPDITFSDSIIAVIFPPQFIFAYQARVIMYFVFWFHLIYGFERKK